MVAFRVHGPGLGTIAGQGHHFGIQGMNAAGFKRRYPLEENVAVVVPVRLFRVDFPRI